MGVWSVQKLNVTLHGLTTNVPQPRGGWLRRYSHCDYFFLAFFTVFFRTTFFAFLFAALRDLPAGLEGVRFWAVFAGAAGFMPSVSTPRSHFQAAGPHSRSLRAAMWPSTGYTTLLPARYFQLAR